MSLVSNFIGGIGGINQGLGASGVSGFDLNDTTFEDLLNKQIGSKNGSENVVDITSLLGAPAGFEIENLEGVEFSEKAQDQMEALGEKLNLTQEATPFDMNKDGEITTQEAITFFSSLLDNSAKGDGARSELFDFAKKQATNLYNRYSRSVITDVKEFVQDIHELMS